MKCGNNHEVAEGNRFCGDCGGEAQAESPTMAKCTACAVEQPTENHFCGQCGGAMPTDEAELDSLMIELAKPLAKSTATAVQAPTDADEELLNETGDDVAAIAATSDAPDFVMAKALVDRLNLVGRQNKQILAAASSSDPALSERVGIMSKALALLGRFRASQATPSAPEAPRGPRSAIAGTRTVQVMQKAVSGGVEGEAHGPRGHVLMAKALTAKSAGRLSASEITRLNFFTNRNASLDDVAKIDEPLAERVAAAIAA